MLHNDFRVSVRGSHPVRPKVEEFLDSIGATQLNCNSFALRTPSLAELLFNLRILMDGQKGLTVDSRNHDGEHRRDYI